MVDTVYELFVLFLLSVPLCVWGREREEGVGWMGSHCFYFWGRHFCVCACASGFFQKHNGMCMCVLLFVPVCVCVCLRVYVCACAHVLKSLKYLFRSSRKDQTWAKQFINYDLLQYCHHHQHWIWNTRFTKFCKKLQNNTAETTCKYLISSYTQTFYWTVESGGKKGGGGGG